MIAAFPRCLGVIGEDQSDSADIAVWAADESHLEPGDSDVVVGGVLGGASAVEAGHL
jgi:hypothetical protein